VADSLPRRAPRLALAGVVVIVVALITEVTAALAGSSAADHAGHGGHLVALIGMVLVLVGVLRDGMARGREATSARTGIRSEEVSDALR